jgi:2-polyprenyl-6-hydroxyphenyl methylase/3-demethylubiquinone-9 3-methyltransferase
MIDHARILTQHHSLRESISYSTLSTIERLPYDSGSFDGIICSSVIEYLPDPDACISEFHRVLRPEGTVLVSFANKASLVRQIRRLAYVTTQKLGMGILAPYMVHSINEYSFDQAFNMLRKHGLWPAQANFAGTSLPRLLDQLSFIGNLINVRAVKLDDRPTPS